MVRKEGSVDDLGLSVCLGVVCSRHLEGRLDGTVECEPIVAGEERVSVAYDGLGESISSVEYVFDVQLSSLLSGNFARAGDEDGLLAESTYDYHDGVVLGCRRLRQMSPLVVPP